MANKKTEQRRLLDIVLEKLEDKKFLAKFKKPNESHKAIHDAVRETLDDGHEVVFSKKDLIALASLDVAKYSEMHKDSEPPVFGFIFFGSAPDVDEKKK